MVDRADQRRAKLATEIQQDIAAAERYADTHGSFADLVREHYWRGDSRLSCP